MKWRNEWKRGERQSESGWLVFWALFSGAMLLLVLLIRGMAR